MSAKPIASLSLDLDNKWSYLKTHGDPGWQSFPTYLPLVVPRILRFFEERDLSDYRLHRWAGRRPGAEPGGDRLPRYCRARDRQPLLSP